MSNEIEQQEAQLLALKAKQAQKLKAEQEMQAKGLKQQQADMAKLKDLSGGKDRAKYAGQFDKLLAKLKADLQGGAAITIEKYLSMHDERSLMILEKQLAVLNLIKEEK